MERIIPLPAGAVGFDIVVHGNKIQRGQSGPALAIVVTQDGRRSVETPIETLSNLIMPDGRIYSLSDPVEEYETLRDWADSSKLRDLIWDHRNWVAELITDVNPNLSIKLFCDEPDD